MKIYPFRDILDIVYISNGDSLPDEPQGERTEHPGHGTPSPTHQRSLEQTPGYERR